MLWMKHRGIISVSMLILCNILIWLCILLFFAFAQVANSILNSNELDQTVAHLLVTARNDGYAQGYAECTQHVTNALKVDWDTNRSATHGVDTETAHAAAKAEYNTFHLPMMDLVTAALQSEDFVMQLKEVFPDEADDDEDLD
ncbi:hypothetical protein HanLR1_Chr13g0487161 [Helianthus annuus]|nr:hypothetical protein HanLR1_Chr13g0487161 [Helianthus annuus]